MEWIDSFNENGDMGDMDAWLFVGLRVSHVVVGDDTDL